MVVLSSIDSQCAAEDHDLGSFDPEEGATEQVKGQRASFYIQLRPVISVRSLAQSRLRYRSGSIVHQLKRADEGHCHCSALTVRFEATGEVRGEVEPSIRGDVRGAFVDIIETNWASPETDDGFHQGVV